MLISHRYEYIFIATTKTGSTSIIQALKDHGDATVIEPKHKYALEARMELPDDIWRNYYKFAFVRNPYDWVASWYYYRAREMFRDGKNPHHSYTGNVDFSDFVKRDREWPMTQSEFIVDENGEFLMDFVGRYENLQTDFDKFCDHVGLTRLRLPSLNRSNNLSDPRKLYNDDLIAVVARRDKAIIRMFDYGVEYSINKRKGRTKTRYAIDTIKGVVKHIRKNARGR